MVGGGAECPLRFEPYVIPFSSDSVIVRAYYAQEDTRPRE